MLGSDPEAAVLQSVPASRAPLSVDEFSQAGAAPLARPPHLNGNGVGRVEATGETAEQVAMDVAAVGRLSAVPTLLRVICESTGMGFAAVARVSDTSWTACAVYDAIDFGLLPGGQLALETTLCNESRAVRAPIVIEHASEDPIYVDHPTPRMYKIESYASFPIVLEGGEYFGNLCCIDPRPARIDEPRTRAIFERFAELIAIQLGEDRRREAMQSDLTSERAVSELREQFIAILGHDLRNPLAAVSACTQVLKLKIAEPAAGKLLDQVLKNVKRMAGLIDDTLDFARGRLGGGLTLKLTWSDGVAAAIDDIVDAARIAHPGRRIVSHVAVDRAIRCDLPRIQQIASNLVGNAIAHGARDGDIEVRTQCSAERLEISVWNQGDAIAASSLAKIFEPFWRQVSGLGGDGLGLGLYICSQIAKAHGGALTVSSSDREGTLFAARLPSAGPTH